MNKNYPKRKRLNRIARLRNGKSFIEKYDGKSLVKGYSKWYGVDKLCAINELRMLGVEITEGCEKSIRNSIFQNAKNKKKANSNKFDLPSFEIIGETSNGVPYGIIYNDEIKYFEESMFCSTVKIRT